MSRSMRQFPGSCRAIREMSRVLSRYTREICVGVALSATFSAVLAGWYKHSLWMREAVADGEAGDLPPRPIAVTLHASVIAKVRPGSRPRPRAPAMSWLVSTKR